MKNYLFRRKFKKVNLQRSLYPEFIERITSVNLIFDAGEVEDRKSVERFTQELEKLECKVYILGYINYAIKEELSFGFDIYDKSKVNWYGVPDSDSISAFCSRPVDLTILANLQDRAHMDYVAHSCDSVLKMGVSTRYSDYQNIFLTLPDKSVQEFFTGAKRVLQELKLLPLAVNL